MNGSGAMRIWILTSELPDELAGGIARYVDNFARALGPAGHEVLVLARTREPLDRELAPGARIVGIVSSYESRNDAVASPSPDEHPSFPYNIMDYWPALSYQFEREVARLARAHGPPDVIESQEYVALPYYLQQRKLIEDGPLSRTPIVVHMHSAYFELMKVNQAPRFRFPDYWVGQMEKFCILAADALLCPSYYLTRSIRAEFEQPLDISTIPLPFVADYDSPISTGRRGEIVYVGRLEWRKGVPNLVRACARLWDAGHDFNLTLIGGDTHFAPRGTTVGTILQNRYKRWIEAGRLRLPGQVRHTQVRELVRSAWAAIVPSHWENFPNTCIESMAAGQLTIGSREGGQAEMIAEDGENGLLFDWNVAGDLEQTLLRALELPDAERQRIARNGQQRIRALCEPAAVLPRRIEHFERLIRRHSPRTVFPTVSLPPRRERYVESPRVDGERSDDPAHARASSLIDSAPAQPVGTTFRAGTEFPDEVKGLLSVVIPFYNLGEFVEETLAAALTSSYRPLEVIIVDDGSSDAASRDRLDAIAARGLADVRVIRVENQGLASARNRGLRLARGEFVALLDADDKIEPDFYARAIAVLNRYANVGFVYSWVRYFESGAGVWPTWNAEFPYLLGHNMTCVLAVLRRSAFLEIGGANPVFAYNYEDYAGWVALADAGWAGVSIPEPLVLYRIRPGSMLRSRTDDQFLYLHDLLTQVFPHLYARWGADLFNLQNANGPGREWNHPAIAAAPPPSEQALAHLRALEAQRAELEKYVGDLTREIERQTAHGRAGWDEATRLAQAWEHHTSHIRELNARVSELDTVKDQLWSELQALVAANGNSTPADESAPQPNPPAVSNRGWKRFFLRSR